MAVSLIGPRGKMRNDIPRMRRNAAANQRKAAVRGALSARPAAGPAPSGVMEPEVGAPVTTYANSSAYHPFGLKRLSSYRLERRKRRGPAAADEVDRGGGHRRSPRC